MLKSSLEIFRSRSDELIITNRNFLRFYNFFSRSSRFLHFSSFQMFSDFLQNLVLSTVVRRLFKKKKKKKISKISRSHNNLKIDFLFSTFDLFFVFFQKKNDCHENFRFFFVFFETSFFLNLSERKKKNETFRNIN
jgi:hypothetical protein